METEWHGLKLEIPQGVYAPREDSFLLAQAVEEFATGTVLDVGTGSGLSGIAAASKKSVNSVVCVDVSDEALEAARANAEKNSVAKKMAFLKSDLFTRVQGEFNVICFNPPYVPSDSRDDKYAEAVAWKGGRSGRMVIDRFLDDFEEHLEPKGMLLFLSSTVSGHGETLEVLKKKGFETSIVGEESFFFEKIFVIKAVK